MHGTGGPGGEKPDVVDLDHAALGDQAQTDEVESVVGGVGGPDGLGPGDREHLEARERLEREPGPLFEARRGAAKRGEELDAQGIGVGVDRLGPGLPPIGHAPAGVVGHQWAQAHRIVVTGEDQHLRDRGPALERQDPTLELLGLARGAVDVALEQAAVLGDALVGRLRHGSGRVCGLVRLDRVLVDESRAGVTAEQREGDHRGQGEQGGASPSHSECVERRAHPGQGPRPTLGPSGPGDPENSRLASPWAVVKGPHAFVAQLDRAPGFEPGGRRFEPFRAHFVEESAARGIWGRFYFGQLGDSTCSAGGGAGRGEATDAQLVGTRTHDSGSAQRSRHRLAVAWQTRLRSWNHEMDDPRVHGFTGSRVHGFTGSPALPAVWVSTCIDRHCVLSCMILMRWPPRYNEPAGCGSRGRPSFRSFGIRRRSGQRHTPGRPK